MKTVITQLLILITLASIPSGIVYAASNDNTGKFEAAPDNANAGMLEKEFDFENVPKEVSSSDNSVQLAVIDNAHNYVVITAVLYAFSLIIITILMKITPQHQAKDIVTAVGLVSVIFGSILLVLVVDTTETLTAPMGILGAIAGYLFGTAQKKEG